MRFPSSRPRHGHGLPFGSAALLACLLTLGPLRGAPATASAGTEAGPPLRSINDFYAVPPVEMTKARSFCWDLDILYSDPDWNLLWVHSDGLSTFIPTEKGFPRFQYGQRVRAEGELVPAAGVSLTGARLTPLPERAALKPLDVTGRLAEFPQFNERLVTLEAIVDRQSDSDPAHLMLEASAEGCHLVIRIQVEPDTARPALEGAQVRATGVLVAHRDFSGNLSSIALWVSSLEALEVRGNLADDAGFKTPVVRIDEIATRTGGRPVHIIGTVHAFDNTAATITLRDATGQIDVITAQSRDVRLGASLEAVGIPETAGLQRRLRNARVRVLADHRATTAPKGDAASPFRLVDQVLALEPEAADRGQSVQLFGVATWMAADQGTIFMQDVSGGVEVRLPPMTKLPPVLPCTVRIAGRTARGSFAPLVAASMVVWSNPLGSPDPHSATLDEMMSGNLHGRWVATSAYLRAIDRTPQAVRLELTTASGEFTALLPGNAEVAAVPGSIISLRGVCCAIANTRRQLAGVQLLVPGAAHLEIEQAAPADPFALPVRSLAGLREFGPTDSTLRRICTLGTVLLHEPGRYLCLQDGTDSLLVLSRDPAPLQPGDRVEVVGLPGTAGSRIVLREAAYRRTGAGDTPAAVPIASPETIDSALDGRLVELRGTVVALHRQHTGCMVTVQAGKRRFDAHIACDQLDAARCPERAVVALQGVYRVVYDEYRQPIDFHLRLRSAADIALLEAPPLLTVERTLWIVGGLLVFTGAVLGWLAVLRARVARQTALIRAQLEHQAKLEADLQKAQRIESLGLLAGGIAHDFNNLLTGILGNLSFARLEVHEQDTIDASLADAELAALRARDLTQRLLVFTKGGTPARAAVNLRELVDESVKLALHSTPVRAEVEQPATLWLAEVDRVQIGQVVQNLAVNALQAMPKGGVVKFALANAQVADGFRAALRPGRYLRLTVSDTGTGIPPEVLPKIFDPYFTTKKTGTGLGLATVFSIVRRHGGHIEVESQAGHGTTFRLWLPAAAADATVPDGATALPAPVATPAPEAVRLLVVDDDVTIRRMAAITLLRAGYEVATAAGGREALELVRAAQVGRHPIRLALVDLTIPGDLGAREIQAGLRAIDPQLRLVLSTGRSDDPTFLASAEHGFDAALAKPYETQELLARVAATLRR